jgi:hypothetical protein
MTLSYRELSLQLGLVSLDKHGESDFVLLTAPVCTTTIGISKLKSSRFILSLFFCKSLLVFTLLASQKRQGSEDLVP